MMDVYALIAELRGAGARFCVATVARTADATSAKAGAKAVIAEDGAITGFLGGACVQGAARAAAAQALADGAARLIRVKPAAEVASLVDADGAPLYRSGCPSGGTVEILIEPCAPPMRLTVLGSGPVAQALAAQGRLMGWRVALADAAGFAEAANGLGPQDVAVVAAQGQDDRAALRAALESGAGHVAMVASRRKAATLVARLVADGLDPGLATRLQSPAGLDLGGVDPAEIAVAVAADLVRRRAVRRAGARAQG